MTTKRSAVVISKKGGDRIGSYLWWGLREIEITRSRLARLFDEHKLSRDYMPPPIVGHAAFRKAVAAVKLGKSGVLVRFIKESPQEIIYGVVRENVDDAAEDLNYKVKSKIVFRKRTESVVLRGNHPIARDVKMLFEEYKDTYIHVDIRRWLVRMVNEHMDAVVLRLNGGVYFIPDTHTKLLSRVRQVISDLPGRSDFVVTPIFDSTETTANLGPATHDALAEEIARINQEIEEFKVKLPRRDTLKRRLEDFGKLKARAQLFSDMLRFTSEDLVEGIRDLDTIVEDLLGKAEAEAVRKAQERKAKRRKGYRKEARIVRRVDREEGAANG